MFVRNAEKKLKQLAKGFPIVAVTGPRQSGKTTLVKAAFPKHAYYSLEDLDIRMEAQEDPRGFLSRQKHGVILDEVQHVPALFSYLQTIVDSSKSMGKFILTGSQNFHLQEKISQSLAGRVGWIELLPFSLSELDASLKKSADLDSWIFKGFFPPLYDRKVLPTDWYPRYVQTYIDRDVRSLKNISDLSAFQRFVKLCAGRIGSLLNLSNLSNECGITVNTARAWISVLEASYIIFLLKPHHKNFNKRLVKQPKLYFCDTGLACSLLGVASAKQLASHYLRGELFENMIVLEFLKRQLNRGLPSNLYFWRDHIGNEVDLILEEGTILRPIEIKSGATLNPSFYKGLNYFVKLSPSSAKHAMLIYGGVRDTQTTSAHVISWKNIGDLLV